MYKIIENPHIMTQAEIDAAYTGYWIYVVKANITRHGELLSGMPVVLGSYQFEGVEEGIYKKYDGSEYRRRLSLNLLPLDNTIVSVYGMELKR
jgi:hypothetical protein